MKNIKYLHRNPNSETNTALVYQEKNSLHFRGDLHEVLTTWEAVLAIPEHKLCIEIYGLYSKYPAFFDLPHFGYEMLLRKSALLGLKYSTLNNPLILPEVLDNITRFIKPMKACPFIPSWYASGELIDLVISAQNLYIDTMDNAEAYGIFSEIKTKVETYIMRTTSQVTKIPFEQLKSWVSTMVDLFFWGYGPVFFREYPVENCQPIWKMCTCFMLELMNDNEEDRQVGNNIFSRAAQEEYERNTRE